MLNIIFGIIIESFAQVREKNAQAQYQLQDECFICGVTRDACRQANVDFDQHVANHWPWNYVFYFIYLHEKRKVLGRGRMSRIEGELYERLVCVWCFVVVVGCG